MCTFKILTDLCFTKQKIKTKNGFAEVVCSILVVKMYWQNINKIYADFECNLEGVKSYQDSYTKNINIMLLVVLVTTLFA